MSTKSKEPEVTTKTIEQWTAQDFIDESARVQDDKDKAGTPVLIGAVMLAALREGPNIDKCAAAIGIDPERIGTEWSRLVTARVFHKGKIHAEWTDEEHGGTAFIMDVCVAMGLVQRAKATPKSAKVGAHK